jgi:hypothetical protein
MLWALALQEYNVKFAYVIKNNELLTVCQGHKIV